MFKIFTKYGILYLWYKMYRQKILVITSCIATLILTLAIYADVVDFLKNRELTEYLLYALIGKWLIILTNIMIIALALKPKKINKIAEKNQTNFTKSTPEPKSKIEEEILKQEKLRTRGDMLIKEAKLRKNL